MAWGQARPRQTSIWQPQGWQRQSQQKSSCSAGENKQKQDTTQRKPQGSKWGAEPCFQDFVRMLQRGEMLLCSSPALSSKACSHLSWSQPLLLSPALPPLQGELTKGHIPASNQGMC